MKILHIEASCAYTEGMTYQYNILPEQNVRDGHEVMFIAAARTYRKSIIVPVETEDTVLPSGVRLVRLSNKKIIIPKISQLFNILEGLERTIETFAPDVILFHSINSLGLLTAARYKKNNPNVKLYVDSHADSNNSAKNLLSRKILHTIIWRAVVKIIAPYTEKFLYVSIESKTFLRTYYKVTLEQMEFYPLGGVLPLENEYWTARTKIRNELGLTDSDVLLIHSGKMDKLKRTKDILLALNKCNDTNLRLVIIGDIKADIIEEIVDLISKDDRVIFLGWKSGSELQEYLAAADVYMQPGSQSATMQTSMCWRCALMLYPHDSHFIYLKHNGFFVETIDDMVEALNRFARDRELTRSMGESSYEIARSILDYKVLAGRLYL